MTRITNRTEFEETMEQVAELVNWYEKIELEKFKHQIWLANSEKIDLVFPPNSIPHLLGINTVYLKSTGLFPKDYNSYDLLKRICFDPYKVSSEVSKGVLTYNSFLSDYIDTKIEAFQDICRTRLWDIEFICKYSKENSYITGESQLDCDYFIAYRRGNNLLILGLKQSGSFYYPMTNRMVDLTDEKSKEFLQTLLANQNITLISVDTTINKFGETKKFYYNDEDKKEKYKILEEYSRNYGANISVGSDYQYLNNKTMKLSEILSKKEEELGNLSDVVKELKLKIEELKKELEAKNVLIEELQEQVTSLTEREEGIKRILKI